MTFIMKKKKYKFNVTLTVEKLSSVPFINSVLFVKCRLLHGGTFTDSTDRLEVVNHEVEWNKRFVFTCKTTANTSTGILDSCIMRLSVRKETKGGKSYVKLGYYDLNITSMAGAGLTKCICLLEGYDSRHHRQDNSMLQVTVDMRLLSGDPCFKTPKETCLTDKPGSKDVLNESDILDPSIKSRHNGLSAPASGSDIEYLGVNHVIGASAPNGDLSQTHQHGSQPSSLTQHSTLIGNSSQPNPSNHNSNGSNFPHFDQMTGSGTSAANSVGSAYDAFEAGGSNSSHTSSSVQISNGFNSLPSHSRQGSADSENPSNTRHQPITDIKFNSVDRVGNKRHERAVKMVNGEETLYLVGKKAIDSTRVSADQLVQELLQNNKLDESQYEESPFISDSNGGLALYVGKDGTATIGSRQFQRSKPNEDNGAQYALKTASTKGTPSRKLNRV